MTRVRTLSLIVGFLAVPHSVAAAQRPEHLVFEARPFIGVYVPAGNQRDVLATVIAVGLQGGIVLPSLTLTSTFTAARSDDRRPGVSGDIDLCQIDWGVERTLAAGGLPFRLTPFVGAGLAARIYDSRAPHSPTRKTMGGFAAAGLTRGMGRLGMRVEVRDHLTRYVGIGQRESASLRNDLTIGVGVVRAFR